MKISVEDISAQVSYVINSPTSRQINVPQVTAVEDVGVLVFKYTSGFGSPYALTGEAGNLLYLTGAEGLNVDTAQSNWLVIHYWFGGVSALTTFGWVSGFVPANFQVVKAFILRNGAGAMKGSPVFQEVAGSQLQASSPQSFSLASPVASSPMPWPGVGGVIFMLATNPPGSVGDITGTGTPANMLPAVALKYPDFFSVEEVSTENIVVSRSFSNTSTTTDPLRFFRGKMAWVYPRRSTLLMSNTPF
jgi:hypothetical protein